MNVVNRESFNKLINGKQVSLFKLQNNNGAFCEITNYGGRIVSLWVADKHGDFNDVVLGYHSIDDYLNSDGQYYGAIVGRYANRIANGEFTLEGNTYTLFKNNGPNHLHGGEVGFNNKVWEANQVSDTKLELAYLSVDGEAGYPGSLNVKVCYTLNDDNGLEIEYTATTNKATPVNLTNHAFFNLNGINGNSIHNHLLQIHANRYTTLGAHGIPTGEIASVKNTPLDFTELTPIGKHIDSDHEQIKLGNGYDHNYVLNGTGLKLAARVEEPISGRILEVITNEPGIQLYTSNFLNGTDIGKDGVPFDYRASFCLETQHFPNSPNQENFPSTILHPNETYRSVCIYQFSVNK